METMMDMVEVAEVVAVAVVTVTITKETTVAMTGEMASAST
jgi:hypothetical protein